MVFERMAGCRMDLHGATWPTRSFGGRRVPAAGSYCWALLTVLGPVIKLRIWWLPGGDGCRRTVLEQLPRGFTERNRTLIGERRDSGVHALTPYEYLPAVLQEDVLNAAVSTWLLQYEMVQPDADM